MYIDLSVPLNEQTPHYPEDAAPQLTAEGNVEKDGYTVHILTTNLHIGTHVDAPAHMIAGGKTLGSMPVEHFVGRGVLIDARNGFEFAAVQAADIQAGDIVLFYTGMADRYSDPAYFTDCPVMDTQIARYLVEKKVHMAGVDACSVDNQEGFPNHNTLLAGDVLPIENLTNLNGLVGKLFTVYALPLNIDLDGAPARVIARVD